MNERSSAGPYTKTLTFTLSTTRRGDRARCGLAQVPQHRPALMGGAGRMSVTSLPLGRRSRWIVIAAWVLLAAALAAAAAAAADDRVRRERDVPHARRDSTDVHRLLDTRFPRAATRPR